MPFQQEIKTPAQGIPGTPYSLNPDVVTVKLAASPVTVGCFVWPGTDANTVQNSGTGAPLGLAAVTKTEPAMDTYAEASMVVATGNPVTVVTRGERFAVSATETVVGQKVFASLTDGTLQTAAAGATVAGAVETSFVVVSAAPAGEPFGISNQR